MTAHLLIMYPHPKDTKDFLPRVSRGTPALRRAEARGSDRCRDPGAWLGRASHRRPIT